MEIKNQSFTDSRQVVDGNRYHDCQFVRCEIVYCGGEIPHIVDCSFDRCTWHFDEAAQRTLQFMHLLYHGTGDAGRELIEQTFQLVRGPAQ